MANTALPEATAQDPITPEPQFVAHDALQFDLENPRFTTDVVKSEIDVIRHLYQESDVDELIQSMMSAGYIDFEPMIVQRKTNIVLEGNRRLAALRLLSNEGYRTKLKISLPAIKNPVLVGEQVRVVWVNDRSEARAFIGFKHINGPFKWNALAKAKYAASWFTEGGDIETVSRTLGDNHNTVRRLVNGWFVLKQAESDGFEIEHISKKTFAFSHLYTALTRSSVREMLGVTTEDFGGTPKPNPVPKERLADLSMLMSWLYGQEQKGERTLIESQNPNLNELSAVLGNPEARLMLQSSRNLELAYERVEPPAGRFEEALMVSAKQAEDVMSLAGYYDGDPTLLRVADGLQKTTRSLLVVMRDKNASKGEAE